MLLASSGSEDGPISAETRRVAGLLAREKTGEILAQLHRQPYLAASEVARLEAIHVATAQRYLKELAEAGLVGSRPRTGTQRPTEEYWILDPKIRIEIDLDGERGGAQGMADAARRIAVRDLGPTNVVYDTNPRTGDVEGILILSSEHPRLVEDRIRLSATVGRFLAHLPYSAGHAQSVWEVMQQAGLHEEHLPEVLAAVGRFTAPGRATDPAAQDEDEDSAATAAATGAPDDASLPAQGSARPLDPEIQRLFRNLALRTDRTGSALEVPFLEVSSLDAATDAATDDPDDDDADDAPTGRPTAMTAESSR